MADLIKIDGKSVNSLRSAAKKIGCSASKLSSLFNSKGNLVYYDNKMIERVKGCGIKVVKRKKRSKDSYYGVKVLQVNTGKIFNSIEQAAKAAGGVDSWTMSKKITVSGGFIDNEGNEYKRLTPMVTKRIYNNDGKTVKSKERSKNIIQEKPMVYKKVESKFTYQDLPKELQDLIVEKINDMCNMNKPFLEIKDFMKKMGCKKMIIDLGVEDEK